MRWLADQVESHIKCIVADQLFWFVPTLNLSTCNIIIHSITDLKTKAVFFGEYMQTAAQNPLLRKGCCFALVCVTELSLLGFVQCESLGRRLDVGGVPPISGDPMPHGLCSLPSSQRGNAPHGCCIPCHKSTFLHNRGTNNGPCTVVLLGLAPAYHS